MVEIDGISNGNHRRRCLSRFNLAAKHGLMFGPDPASAERATMGGVIANNATGAHSLSYGMTADHLISADVIASDGSLATLGRGVCSEFSSLSLYSSTPNPREICRCHHARTGSHVAQLGRLSPELSFTVGQQPVAMDRRIVSGNLKPDDWNLPSARRE
jgi:hypothetical protein